MICIAGFIFTPGILVMSRGRGWVFSDRAVLTMRDMRREGAPWEEIALYFGFREASDARKLYSSRIFGARRRAAWWCRT